MFSNPATAWVIIPILIFGIGAIKAILEPFTARIKAGEREQLRKMYERLALEKLDVIKTAITMGYKQHDLANLDTRLEQVIGSEAMQKLLDGKTAGESGKGSGSVIGINIQTSTPPRVTSGDKVVDLDSLLQGDLATSPGVAAAEQAQRD